IDDRAGHQRGLFARKVRGTLAEVRSRRGFAAENTVTPLDHVQIDLENAPLRQARLEPPGDEQLAQLANRVARRGQVRVLRELLGDRARTAGESALLPVPLQRGLDLAEIDAVVVE